MDLAALFDEWASRLLAYMITITRDRHRAEDALQNLFVKLGTSRTELRNPAVYLFRAARNEALRVSRRRPEQTLAGLDVVAPREGVVSPIDPAAVAAALDRLPPEQLEVVVLHALEELTFAETAEILEIPPDTAASRYRYAIAKLREFLSHES